MVPITALYASLLAMFYLWLAKNVIVYRRGSAISLGAGADDEMERRIRTFGNAAEYVPIALVLMALVELQGGGWLVLHVAGLSLAIGRVFHAAAIRSVPHNLQWRVLGMGLTLISIASLAIALLGSAIF